MLQLPTRAAKAIEAELVANRYAFRTVPHALFSAKGEGVVATFYASGKLVVQGEAARMFVERYVHGAVPEAAGASPTADPTHDGGRDPLEATALVGSDETGKGDYFGPLVVCAMRLEPADMDALRGGAVRDSKLVSDESVAKIAGVLRSRYPHAIARLDPPRYNELYARVRNVNELLADLHAQAIREVARPGDHVLVDKFADERLLKTRLANVDVKLHQRVRGEAVVAVAAASIVARAVFLEALRELSDESAVDLHKGAGDPVDRSARRFVAIHGREALVRVAKLHFKNTQRVGGASLPGN